MNNFSLAHLAAVVGGAPSGEPAVPISTLAFDSAKVINGTLFVAIRGTKADGHSFLDQAYGAGAPAAVVEDSTLLHGRPGIVVQDTRLALSRLAALFAGEPAKRMCTVGVTGTNGKTTTNWLLYHLAIQLGRKACRFGTLGIEGEKLSDTTSLTTPDPLLLHQCLAQEAAAGTTFAVFEASSHALDQKRVHDLEFDAGVFTNLTRDHLDYHGTMDQYFAAKTLLFDLVENNSKPNKVAVVNADDQYGQQLAVRLGKRSLRVITFGRTPAASLRIIDFTQSFEGSSFVLHFEGVRYPISSPLIGAHNAENIAAAFGTMVGLGFDVERVRATIAALPQVSGRLESVGNPHIGVFVDYAHTPDALENALKTLRPLAAKNLWVLFGCGGDRDRGKRPQMMAVAERYADKVVVTSDNPRTEDPEAIIADILSEGGSPAFTEPDRAAAIQRSLELASDGDIVLIAGKGHEDYQIIGTTKRHFSDQEEVKRVLWG